MIFTEACRPRISDFDKNGKISYESVLQILEDVGCHHSEFVEKDILERSDEGFGWLLIDWNIHFLHQIKSAKGLTVKTWVRKEHKISSVIRDFVILSDDEIMIKAEAKYCLIDFKTGRPTKINSGILDTYEPETECVFEESPTRLDNLNEYDYKINIQLRKAVKEELIKRNFAEDIVRPTYTEGKRRPITDEEREWFIETAQTHYAGPMVLTMLWCGLRPIEVRRMTWDWIDFESNVLTVGKSKTKAGTGRKIPIPTELSTMLKKLKLKGYNDEYVFVKYNNHCEMDGNSFYQSWRNFLREVEIAHGAEVYRNQIVKHVLADDLEPYLLRHTFCTDCQAAGVPINVAKELMGHSDIQVTAKIYTHMVDEVFETNRQRLQQYNEFKKHQSLA